ncbi:hypothetical protein BS47DRAFT_1340394 [Hydnum rufescens UP504]|uniref:Uncharacterized protein n=1 Tax=Hydnum rufescens UP504 TaxID=1448309 RepID=A0A9P6B4E8_9AGAM|nr:hypothetical protein BS47DRAFT_1340394 [Hydnum rufescens UP504]
MISWRQEHTIVLHAWRIVISTQSICGSPFTHSNPLPMDARQLTIQVQFCALYIYNQFDSLVDSVAHGSFVPDQYRKPY